MAIVLTGGTGALVVAGAALAIVAMLATSNGASNGAQIAQRIFNLDNLARSNGVKTGAKATAAADAAAMPGSNVNFAAAPAGAASTQHSWWAGDGASAETSGAAVSPPASDTYSIAASGNALPDAGTGSPGSYSSDGGQGSSGWVPSAGEGPNFGSPGPGNFPPVYQTYNVPHPGLNNPTTPPYVGPGPYNPGPYVPSSTPSAYVPPGGVPMPPPPQPQVNVAQQPPNTSRPGGPGTPPSIVDAIAPPPGPGQTPQNPLVPANGTNPDVLACAAPNCQGGQWTYFDPEVAIGYNFQLVPGAHTPASDGVSMIRVSTDVGDGDYQLWMLNLAGTWVDMAPIDANPGGISADDFDVVSFLDGLTTAEDAEFGITDPADGLTQFSIRGIDPSAGLDPNNPDEFVTGLQFSSPFVGDVDITPLELDMITAAESYGPTYDPAVPEPPALPVFAAAFGLALLWREARRFRRR